MRVVLSTWALRSWEENGAGRGQEGARKGWLLGTCRSTLMDGWKEVMWGEEGVLTSGGSGISALSLRLDLVEKL